ncbi:hypothetical protein BDF22DRAFT_653730 [Syncephalis plumigaleata]|nr:hypothetical protein BDF22DRAFT_653730 [Syncephalis plumigaleata]
MFIKRALIATICFGAVAYAQSQQQGPEENPAGPGPDGPAAPAGPAPGTPIPVPANQNKLSINSVSANLTGNNLKATVTITTKLQQLSPHSDVKQLILVGNGGFTNTTMDAYRLAVHSGRANSGDCNNTSIGAVLDPDQRFGKNTCRGNANAAAECAIGDLYGQIGGFSGAVNGSISGNKSVEYLPFDNGKDHGIVNRMLMLYEGDKRIACGVIVASNSSTQIPSDISGSSVTLQSPLSTITMAMLGSALVGLVLTTAIH